MGKQEFRNREFRNWELGTREFGSRELGRRKSTGKKRPRCSQRGLIKTISNPSETYSPMARPMTSFMISLVPANTVVMRASM